MKKLNLFSKMFCLLMALSASVVVFNSCDDNNNPSGFSGNIVGKWQLVEATTQGTDYLGNPVNNTFTEDNPDSDNSGLYPCSFRGWREFKSDGTVEDFYDYDCGGPATEYVGTWTMVGNKLTIYDGGLPIIVTVTSLTANELVAYDREEGLTFTGRYIRVN